MPKPTKGPRLGSSAAHERLILANLAASLFTHKRIQTTETRAKRVRPLAERLITQAKRGDLHARRKVLETITDPSVVHELFTEIAPLVADRQGGYTRIVKTGFRKGDNASLAVLELVLEPVTPKGGAEAAPADSGVSAAGDETAPAAGDEASADAVGSQEGADSAATEAGASGPEDAAEGGEPVPGSDAGEGSAANAQGPEDPAEGGTPAPGSDAGDPEKE